MSLLYPNTFHYDFTSASNVLHTITHNLSDLQPQIEVIRDDTNEVIIPASIVIVDANTVSFSFFSARPIRGKITKGRVGP